MNTPATSNTTHISFAKFHLTKDKKKKTSFKQLHRMFNLNDYASIELEFSLRVGISSATEIKSTILTKYTTCMSLLYNPHIY